MPGQGFVSAAKLFDCAESIKFTLLVFNFNLIKLVEPVVMAMRFPSLSSFLLFTSYMYFKIHIFLVSCIIVFAYNDERFNILVVEYLRTNKA